MIKSYKSLRNAAIAGVAGFTAAASVLGSALPAHAVAAATTVTITASSQPTIHPGATAQAAGNEVISTTPAGSVYNVGDTLTFTVDDSNGGNCTTTGDTLGFNGTPVVTVTAPTTGTIAAFSSATSSSAGACTTAGVKNVLTLTATSSGAADSVTVSGIKYDAGSAVAAGNVAVTVAATSTGAGAFTVVQTAASNAKISATAVSADNPPTTVSAGSPGQSISPVTIQEFQPGQVTTQICVTITSANANFTSTNTPTASASGGGAATGTPVTETPAGTTPNTVTVPVSAPSTTAPATFTISNLKIDSTATGPVTASVSTGAACGTALGSVILTSGTSVTRFGGQDRYDTARIIAENTFACITNAQRTAVIARGDLYPDALAGNFLAGRVNGGAGGPILLTMTDSVPASTLSALKVLGITDVVILGQTQAVSAAAESQLKSTPTYNCNGTLRNNFITGSPINLSVTRIGGATRYDTAQLVAESQGTTGAGTLSPNGAVSGTAVPTAILSSGENFPDALAAGPMAYTGTEAANGNDVGFPILLTHSDVLAPQAQQGINDLGIKQVIVTGGDLAIAPAERTALQSQGINVILLAGPNRMGTAAAIASFETAVPAAATATAAAVNGLSYTNSHANLARGDDFADALSGGPHAGAETSPILLTLNPTTLSSETATYLQTHSAVAFTAAGNGAAGGLTSLHIFGGPLAISPAVAQQAANDIS